MRYLNWLKQLRKYNKLWLILFASAKRSPQLFVRFARSEPAKSTMESWLTITLNVLK